MSGGEFVVGGQTYRWSRLDARKQFHVARRLAPILAGIAGAVGAAADAGAAAGHMDLSGVDLNGVADAFASMPDDRADYVLDALLGAVQRQADGAAAWSNIRTPGGAMMFADIDFSQMLQIAWKVLEGNLGGFFHALQSMSPTSEEPSKA